MTWTRRRWRRILLTAVFVAAASSSAYAYTAGGSITATTHASFGQGAIGSYTLSGVQYDLDVNGDPRNVASVTLSFGGSPLPNAGTDVRVQLAAGGPFYTCGAGGATVVCPTSSPVQATAQGATQLTVVAVN